jgi:NDP-sugar pyrophosphorylase family protein
LWTDIGKPEDYLELNKIMLDKNGEHTKSKSEERAEIKTPVAFGREVSIGAQSTIGPYVVLGPRVKVGRNVDMENAIVLGGTEISDFAEVHNAIIGEGAYIGRKVHIRKGCIVGDHARIKDGVSLAAGTSICPARDVVEEEVQDTRESRF